VTGNDEVIGTVVRTRVVHLAGKARKIKKELDPADRRMVIPVRVPGRATIDAGVAVERIEK